MWDGKSSLVISAITSNTPAASADLKAGDKILSLNGIAMSDITEEKFCSFILGSQSDPNSFEKQKRVKLLIKRGEQKLKELELVHQDDK